MTSIDHDEYSLSAETLSILNQFLCEKTERELKEQNQILPSSETDTMFEENWQLSQFWYNDFTKIAIQNAVKKFLEPETHVALLSCPSLYKVIKKIHDNVRLFEFDKRFSVFGNDFVFYDLNEVLNEPDYFEKHAAIYDIIIADPPFLSEECVYKTAHIIKILKKQNAKVLFCSGEVVESWVAKCLDLKRCKFRPEHRRNLANSFISYANFNLDELI